MKYETLLLCLSESGAKRYNAGGYPEPQRKERHRDGILSLCWKNITVNPDDPLPRLVMDLSEDDFLIREIEDDGHVRGSTTYGNLAKKDGMLEEFMLFRAQYGENRARDSLLEILKARA